MDLPVDPVRMTVEELLFELRTAHQQAAIYGPGPAMKFLQLFLRETVDLPPVVQAEAYELLAEAQAALQDWEGCAASMAMAQRVLGLPRAWPDSRSMPGTLTAPPIFQAAEVAPAPPPVKVCQSCGADVSHKPRQKSLTTGTYLCRACAKAQHTDLDPPRLGKKKPGRIVLGMLLVGLLGLVGAGFVLMARLVSATR